MIVKAATEFSVAAFRNNTVIRIQLWRVEVLGIIYVIASPKGNAGTKSR